MGYKTWFLGMGYEEFLGKAVDIFTGFSCERFLGISADFGTPLPCILKHHGLSRKTQASSILWVNVPIHPTLLTFSLASGRTIGFLASHHSINNYEPIVVLTIYRQGFYLFPEQMIAKRSTNHNSATIILQLTN